MFIPVHQQTHLSIYQVARTPYQTLWTEIEHTHWAVSFVRLFLKLSYFCATFPGGWSRTARCSRSSV
jgi:hypothetical protein